jgi:hypothetical protein
MRSLWWERNSMAEDVYVKPGEEWLVVACHNPACKKMLLIEPVVSEMLDEDGILIPPLEILQMTCPHCKYESVYLSDEIRIEGGQ